MVVRQHRSVAVAAMIGVGVVAAVGVYTGLWRYGESAPNVVEAQLLGTATALDAATEPWPPRFIEANIGGSLPTIDDWIDESDVVAEVMVEEVRAPRWNTYDGAVPTMGIRGLRQPGLEIYSAVVLSNQGAYKGSAQPFGYIVPQRGGRIVDTEYEPTPRLAFEAGAVGVVFMVAMPAEWAATPPPPEAPPWYVYLREIAHELAAQGDYVVMDAHNWYHRSPDGVTVSSEADGKVLDSTEFARHICEVLNCF